MIKLIAVDMDGTLLDDNKEYDKKRLFLQVEQMKKQGIHFVVASGNQYAILEKYVREIVETISFVAENGALVYANGKEIYSETIPEKIVQKALPLLPYSVDASIIFCGIKNAYYLESITQERIDFISKYYGKLTGVKDYEEIDDAIFKIALTMPPTTTTAYLTEFNKKMGDDLRAVESGFGFIDLIRKNINKANALKELLRHWNIKEDEIATFGDNYNDLEMLRMTPFSFAMANAVDGAKKEARYTIGSNNDGAVLDTIDALLAGKYNE